MPLIGIFLLENGHDLFMWIGRAVNPAILSTLFNEKSLEGVVIIKAFYFFNCVQTVTVATAAI